MHSNSVFDDVFAPSSWTLPSVASMMTSVYPSIHGLSAHSGAVEFESLRPGLETLPQLFRDRGYRTLAVVTNPWVATPKHGLERGFEEYRYPEDADADAVHRIAREILAKNDPRPLFLYLHYMDVHAPYALPRPGDPDLGPPPERYRRRLNEKELGVVPPYSRLPAAKGLEEYVDAYDRGIRRWDHSFGEFVDWLHSTGRLDDTLVVVVADHGEEFLEHGGWDHGRTLYQEQLLVPWILYIPGSPGRRVDDRVVSLIDVAPTLLGAVGAEIPSTMAGRDMLSARRGRESRTLFSETRVRLGGKADARMKQLAIRRGKGKLILGPRGHWCFDLERDPDERSPIVGAATSNPPRNWSAGDARPASPPKRWVRAAPGGSTPRSGRGSVRSDTAAELRAPMPCERRRRRSLSSIRRTSARRSRTSRSPRVTRSDQASRFHSPTASIKVRRSRSGSTGFLKITVSRPASRLLLMMWSLS